MLRPRLVDRDHGKAELPLPLQGLEPDHPGRRLLGTGDDVSELLSPVRVENADDVGAVVHGQVRPMVDGRLDVPIVGVVVLALDREDRDAVLLDEGRGDVVLCGQRVRCAEHDVRASGLESAREVRGLGRHVQARRYALPREGLLLLESFPDRGQHRHLPVGPSDPAHAFCGERQVLDIMAFRGGHGSFPGSARSSSSASCSQKPFMLAREPCVDSGSQGRLPAKAQREGELADLDAEHLPELGEAAQLVQLADPVQPVAALRPARHDEARPLEIPEHAGRPSRSGGSCPDGELSHGGNLSTIVSSLIYGADVPSRP